MWITKLLQKPPLMQQQPRHARKQPAAVYVADSVLFPYTQAACDDARIRRVGHGLRLGPGAGLSWGRVGQLRPGTPPDRVLNPQHYSCSR